MSRLPRLRVPDAALRKTWKQAPRQRVPACSKTGAVLRQFPRNVLQLKDFSEKREKLLAKPLGLT